MGWFDDFVDTVGDVADAASDFVGGGFEDAVAAVGGGDSGGWFGGLGGIVETVTETVSGGDGGLFGSFGDMFGGIDLGGIAETVGGALDSGGGLFGGDWGGVLDTVVETVTTSLPDVGSMLPGDLGGIVDTVTETVSGGGGGFFDSIGDAVGGIDLGGIGSDLLGGGGLGGLDLGGIGSDLLGGDGLGGVVDWATGMAEGVTDGGFLDGLDLGGVGDYITDCWGFGDSYGDLGFGEIADWGMEQLEQIVPGAGDIGGSLLDGIDPGGLLDVLPADVGGLAQDVISVVEGAAGGGFDFSDLGAIGERLGIDVPDDLGGLDDLIGALGDGGTSTLIETFGSEIGGFVDQLGGDGAADLVGRLVDEGTFDQFVGTAGGALSGLVGKLAEGGALEDTIARLDPQQTAELVRNLVGQAGGATAAATEAMATGGAAIAGAVATATEQGVDLREGEADLQGELQDVMQATADTMDDAEGAALGGEFIDVTMEAAEQGLVGAASTAEQAAVTAQDAVRPLPDLPDQAAAAAHEAVAAAGPPVDDMADLVGDVSAPQPLAEPLTAEAADMMAPPPAPEPVAVEPVAVEPVEMAPMPEPEPIVEVAPPPDDFSIAVEAAEQVESSVDDMFDDLGGGPA